MAKKKRPKIALLRYCQPTGLKNKSPRLETMCTFLKEATLRKRDSLDCEAATDQTPPRLEGFSNLKKGALK